MAFERKSYQEYRRQNTGSVNNGGTQTNTQPDSTVKFKRKSYHEYLNSESKTDLAGFDSYQQWLNHAHQAISDYNQLAEKAKDYDSGKKFSAYQAQNAARFGNLRNEWNQQRDAIDNLIATGGISSEQGQAYKKQAKEIAGILSNMAKDTSAADYWKQWESEADYAATQEQQRIAGLDMESLNRKLEELDRTISKLRRNGAGYDYQANPQAYETYWRQVGELEQIRTQTKKDREALGTYQQQQKSAEAAQKEAERIAGLDMESLQRIREIYTENRNRIEQEKLQYDTISQQEQIDGLIRKQELNQQQLDEVNRDIYARERYEKGLEYQRIYETRKEDAYLPGLKDRTYQLVNGTWTNLKENLYSGMEEAERQIYNTIVAQQGLTKGEEYLEWLKPELNRRYAAQMHERLADTANAHPIAGMMMNVGAGLWKPLGYGYTAVQNIANRVNNEYQPIDPNAGWFAPNIASEATTEGLTRDMSDAGKFLTQTGLSIAQNLFFMGFGEATSLALMGLGSASDTSREILQRGGSNEQAAWGGAAAGAAEVLFEKVSLDSLIRLKDTDNLRDAVGNILKQAGVEASEEAFTELTNNLSDQLINGGLSNYQQAVQRYMAQGMEEAEAKKAASAEVAGEIGLAALGGALSGGVLAGGKTVMQYNGGQQAILQERERENRALQEDARARYEVAKKQVEAAQASAQTQDTAAAQQSKTGEAAGRTEVTYRADGARTEATGIDRIEANGKTYVKTADGNTTALEELSFAEERMGMLYENAELFGTEGGRAYVSGYDGRDIGIYTNGWAGVYNRAANGSSEAAAVKYGKEAGLSEAQALSAYYSGRNSYAAGESKHGLPETEPAENREEDAIGSRIKYSIKTESIEAIERKNYERWQAVKAATRQQSRHLDITDDRNVARYRNEVDEAMRDEKTRNIMLGMPNELLLKAGFTDAPIYLDASNLTKIAYPYGFLGNTDGKNRHDLGFSVIKNLIYQIAKPLAITENTSKQMQSHLARGQSSRILFTEWVDQKNRRIIVPVSISEQNKISVEEVFNEVKSAYGAEEKYLEQLKDVKVIYPENEKDVSALITSDRQTRLPEAISDDIFAKSILYSKDFSNTNIRQKGKKDTTLRKEKFAGETKRLVHHYSGTLTTEQQDTLRILDIAAQVLDRTVYIEDSIDGEIAGQRAERGANAYFDPRDNSYHLALDATQQGYLTIMLHEAVHDIAANNRAGYEQLAEVVMKYLQEEKAQEQVREDILRYEQRGYREAEEIEEELVANAVGVILNDRRTAEEFAKRFLARDTKVRKAFMRILDNLREYLKRTIAAIKGEADFRQTELLEKRAGAIEEIRQAMFDAMEGLQNNGQAETTSKKAKKLSPRLETDFAEKYSIDIQANRNEIAQMEAVAKLTGNEFAKSEISLPDMIAAYFSKIGNSVHHALLGDIVLDRRGIKDDIAHGIGRRKAAAFMAIPEVIRNGKIVDIRYDWKNRGYDTVILAAPIKIGTESYLMGVVVNKNVETDRLYVHEVLAINKEGQQSLFKTGGPVKNGVNPGSEAAPSVISILQNILNDNPSIRENEGNDAKEYSEKEKQTLTEEEEYAIRSYKSGLTSYLLNEKLYSGAELSEADMYLMKEIDSALDKLPVYEGKTYRNITFYRQGRAARNAFLNMHVPNTMITYDAYTSSSKAVDGYMLEGDNVVHIEIDGHSGRDISASSLGSTVEQEVLYRRESMFFVDEVTIAEDGNPKIILQEVAENGLERRGDTDSGERGAAMRVMQELHSPESSVQGISEQDTGRNFERESGSSLAIQGGQRDFIRSGRSGTSPDGAVREAYGEIEKDDADKKKYSLKSTETAYEEWEVQTALYDALDHADTGFDNLIRVGPMPHYITNLLGIEGDFFIQRNHAYENMVSQKQALQDGRPVTNRGKDVHFHALGLERMTDAIMGLENPIITMKTKNNDGNPTIIMMLHERGTDGNPLSAIFSFYANKTENGKRERRPHVVLTIAERNMQRKANDGRAAWSEIIQNAIDNGNILDINEKRDVPPVIANTTSVGNITTTSLNENVAQFRQEIKAFKEKNKIRYSLKSTEAAVIIQPNDEQQAEQLEKLRSTLDRQYRLKAGRQMTREAAEKLAGRAIRRFHSGYAAEKLAADLQTIFDEAGRNFDADIFLAEGARAMKGVLAESSTFDKAAYAQYAPVRELLKQKMTLTETQKEEAAAIFGSYGEYRRQLFGSTSLGPGGTSLDIAWQELHRLAPELFPAESTEGDMVSALYDAVQAVKKENFYVNEFAMNLDEAATVAFADLYAEYADLTPIKMLARQMELYAKRYARESEREAGQRQRLRQEEEKRDYESLKQKRKEEQKKITRWEAQRKAELREQNSRIRALQAQKQEAMGGMQRYALDAEITRLEDVKAEIDARYDRMIRNERTLLEEMGKALEKAAGSSTRLAADARQQMLYGKTAAKMAENRQKQAATRKRQAVRRKIGALMHTISAGTDAKHIPEALRNTVAEFLQKIDPSFREDSKAAWKWREQTAVLAARMEEYNLSGGQMQVDAYIIAQLRTIGEDIAARIQTAGSSIREMKLTELQKLDETLDLLGAAIRNSDRILAEERSTRLAAVAQQSMEELRQRKAYQGRMKGMNELLNLQQLDAFSFAEKLGPAFQNSIFKNLRSGLDHKIQMLQEASAAMEQAAEQLPGKRMRDKLKALSGEQANTTIFTLENGTQIRLTTGQIMELYLLNQREAGRRHIYRGGITVEEYTAGRRKVKKQSRKQVSEADIDAITEMLTPAQKRFAEMLQHFCATTGSEWGNRVSLSLWGIKKFTDQRYWPIRVDNNTLETNTMPVDASSIARLKNIGMSQSTNPGAGNALILGDVIDTYIRHMDDMTSYAAYVLPLEDAQRWLNYHGEDGTTMKESVEKALGRGGVDYLKDFLETLNGGKRKGDSAPNWYNRLMRNYKIAAVAANLRVVIQQPSAYARAAAEIAPKYLLHAGKSRAQQESGMRMAQRYAPIFAWKQWGFRDTFVAGDLRSIMVGDRSFYEQIIQQSGALAGLADDMTWGALWNACAAEIRDTTTLEEGTEAFNRRVGERFGEVIDKTQVVDSPFHRSMGMRSGNNIWKTMTAFMSEPIKSYNMLYRAVADLRQSGWKDKAAWQRAVRSGTAFAAQNIINSLLAAVIDVFRDDDRDETLAEKYFGHALENFLEGINPLETIPLAGDLLESLAPMLEGENPDFSNFQSDLGYEGLANLLTAAYDLYNSLGDYKKNDYYAIYKLISALGQVMGIPIGNAWRMVNSILQTAGVEITPYTKLATPYTAAEHAIKEIEAGRSGQATVDAYAEARGAEMLETQPEKYTDIQSAQNFAGNEVYRAMAILLSRENEAIPLTYAARERADTAEVDRIRAELTAKGYPAEVVDEAILIYASDMQEQKAYGEKEYQAQFYHTRHLEKAIDGGNLQDIRNIRAELIRDSTAQDPTATVDQAGLSYVRQQYLQAYESGASTQGLKRIATEIFGATEEQLQNWLLDDRSGDFYTALEAYDTTAANRSIAQLKELGREEKSITTSVTRKYREKLLQAYQSGEMGTVNRLMDLLHGLALYDFRTGEPYYSYERMWGWLEAEA